MVCLLQRKMPHKGRCPADIPAYPDEYLRRQGLEWLERLARNGAILQQTHGVRSFREARVFAHKLKLKSSAEWIAFCKGEMPRVGHKPADIPSNPNQTYADKGWKGMGDWLGTGTIAPRLRVYRPFYASTGLCQET